jgi:uncharacterized protein with PIN domain
MVRRATTQPPLGFAVDHMLIKLGKYLRIVGLDAAWDERLSTRLLVLCANAEGRVLLTRNGRLDEARPHPRWSLHLGADDSVAQLRHVLSTFGIDPLARLFTRCIRCNVELEELCELGEHGLHLLPAVRARYQRFWRCPRCATVFWHGSHVRNTCRKLGLAQPVD